MDCKERKVPESTELKQAEIYAVTGGMGSGKSTVSKRFNTNGAVVVDADQVVRDLQLPGSPMLEVMAGVLGDDIIVDGGLDRERVSSLIFSDTSLNERLRSAMNPGIFAEIEARVSRAREDDTVIFDVPLLNPAIKIGERALSGIIVVDVPIELAVERLSKYRHVSEAEARRRLSHQISREQRLQMADYVIENTGTLAELNEQTDEVWRAIRAARVSGKIAVGGSQ